MPQPYDYTTPNYIGAAINRMAERKQARNALALEAQKRKEDVDFRNRQQTGLEGQREFENALAVDKIEAENQMRARETRVKYAEALHKAGETGDYSVADEYASQIKQNTPAVNIGKYEQAPGQPDFDHEFNKKKNEEFWAPKRQLDKEKEEAGVKQKQMEAQIKEADFNATKRKSAFEALDAGNTDEFVKKWNEGGGSIVPGTFKMDEETGGVTFKRKKEDGSVEDVNMPYEQVRTIRMNAGLTKKDFDADVLKNAKLAGIKNADFKARNNKFSEEEIKAIEAQRIATFEKEKVKAAEASAKAKGETGDDIKEPTWNNASNILEGRFFEHDRFGNMINVEENRGLHRIAANKLVEYKKEKMKPLEAVNNAEKAARQIERGYWKALAAYPDRKEEVDKAYRAEYGYLPKKKPEDL